MQTVAAGWLIFDLTGSGMALGLLTALSRGPALFVSTYGGVLAERFDRRQLVIVLSVLQAAPAALLAVLSWAGSSSPLEIYLCTLVIGIAGALDNTPIQEITTATVPRDQAKQATALASVSYNVARLVGPSVGGVLLATIGPGPCFAINAASFVAVILMVATLPHKVGGSPKKPPSVLAAVKRVRFHPLLRAIFLGVLLFSLLVGPVQELAPAIARHHGGGAHLLGFLLSGLAVGGLIAVPLRSWLERHGVQTTTALRGSMLMAAASLLLLAATSSYAVAFLAMVACGTAWDVLYILGMTGVQFADERFSGLMVGLYFTASLGGVTLGALLVGGLFDVLGIGWALSACALTVALGAMLAIERPSVARLDAA